MCSYSQKVVVKTLSRLSVENLSILLFLHYVGFEIWFEICPSLLNGFSSRPVHCHFTGPFVDQRAVCCVADVVVACLLSCRLITGVHTHWLKASGRYRGFKKSMADWGHWGLNSGSGQRWVKCCRKVVEQFCFFDSRVSSTSVCVLTVCIFCA